MSVNFCDNSGLMAGCDLHTFLTLVPPSPLPVPVPFTPHIVAVPYFWPPAMPKRCGKVTADSWKMAQDGLDLYLVPHVPIPPGAPHPGELAWWATMVFLPSGSKCFMSVHSVSGEGENLATCLLGPVGMNMNCNDPFDMPTNLVLNLSTVKTSPTLGDYIGAFVGAAVDSALSWGLGKLLGPAKNAGKRLFQSVVKQFVRRFPDITKAFGDPGFADPPGAVKKGIQRAIDGEPVFGK